MVVTRRAALSVSLCAALWLGTVLRLVPVAAAAPATSPGAHLVSTALSGSGQPYLCTLGFVVQDSHGAPGALTAGHCKRDDDSAMALQRTPNGDVAVGEYARWEVHPGFRDVGLVTLFPPTQVLSSDVDGKRVSKVLTPADLRNTPDTVLCKSGARTGVSCGTIVYLDNYEVRFRAWDDLGDSGSPVYAHLPDGTVGAVGVLYGHSDDAAGRIIHATLLAPVLRDWGLQLY